MAGQFLHGNYQLFLAGSLTPCAANDTLLPPGTTRIVTIHA